MPPCKKPLPIFYLFILTFPYSQKIYLIKSREYPYLARIVQAFSCKGASNAPLKSTKINILFSSWLLFILPINLTNCTVVDLPFTKPVCLKSIV